MRGRALPRTAWFVAALAAVAVIILRSSTAPAAVGVFSLDRLRLGDGAGPESYIYTAGNTIFPDGGVDPATYYKFVVKDAAGTVRNPSFPCTPAASFTSTENRYSVQPADPVSTGTAWKFTLNQYTNSGCTGTRQQDGHQELLRREGARASPSQTPRRAPPSFASSTAAASAPARARRASVASLRAATASR